MPRRSRPRTPACLVAAALLFAAAELARAQAVAMPSGGTPPAGSMLPAGCAPFAAGESLSYAVKLGFGLRVGSGSLVATVGDTVRGVDALRLRFVLSAGAGPVKATQHTTSWVDPASLATLRFIKHERSPITRTDDSVEVFPRERRWAATKGELGYAPSELPLDELSFLYFLRTLPLGLDSSWSLTRHYDPARSPTRIRVLGRESIETKAGKFMAWRVELAVKDPTHFRGLGLMRLHVTDDARRLPVRIEADMREAGSTVLELVALPTTAAACTPRVFPDTIR